MTEQETMDERLNLIVVELRGVYLGYARSVDLGMVGSADELD